MNNRQNGLIYEIIKETIAGAMSNDVLITQFFSLFNFFKNGIRIIAEIMKAIQSATGVAHAIPFTPMIELNRTMKTISKLPLRSNESNSGCTVFPRA